MEGYERAVSTRERGCRSLSMYGREGKKGGVLCGMKRRCKGFRRSGLVGQSAADRGEGIKG